MPDHSSDVLRPQPVSSGAAVSASSGARTRRSSRPRRTDWRLGGQSVRRWRGGLLIWAICGIGAGVVAAALVRLLWDSSWAAPLSTVLLWAGMLVPIVRGLTWSRPVGLFRLRAIDVLFGLALGVLLRAAQGWLAVAFGGSGAFPVSDRGLGPWQFAELIASFLVSPLLEELAFHAVILIACFTVLRRPLGKRTAAVVAILVSTGLFLLMYGVIEVMAMDAVVSIALLSLVCGALVICTGRIWAAIFTHGVYSASYAALVVVGDLLA